MIKYHITTCDSATSFWEFKLNVEDNNFEHFKCRNGCRYR